jgi:hypothetical protein
MKRAAVEQAKTKFAKAEKSLQLLKDATEFKTAEEAWTDFLLAVSGIYNKLEQGSKGNGKSEGWFGKKKHDRRKDALLRYLHLARNSSEHGIERIVDRKAGSTFLSNLRGPLRFDERVPIKICKVDKATGTPVGEPVDAFVPGPHLELIRVRDSRYNDICDPPKEHMGSIIDHRFPYDTAVHVLPYLKALVSEAETLV